MTKQDMIKKNHERAQEIVNSWPTWKKEFSITKYSVQKPVSSSKKQHV